MSPSVEDRWSDILKKYAKYRSLIIDRVHLPLSCTEQFLTPHIALVTTTIILICALYTQLRRLTLFSMHPLCMTCGILLFMAEAIITFRNRQLLETVSPIMQHSKRTKVSEVSTTLCVTVMQGHTIHSTLNVLAVSFILAGLAFISWNKVLIKHSLIPNTLHALFGCLSILFLLLQVYLGYEKLRAMEEEHNKILRWHGDFGLMLWDTCMVTMCLGVAQFFIFGYALLLLACLIYCWYIVHHAMAKQRAAPAPEVDPAALLVVEDDADVDGEAV